MSRANRTLRNQCPAFYKKFPYENLRRERQFGLTNTCAVFGGQVWARVSVSPCHSVR
jgi:hypothetical protein